MNTDNHAIGGGKKYTLKQLILADFDRILRIKFGKTKVSKVKMLKLFVMALFLDESFMLMFWFRVASWLRSKCNPLTKLLYIPVRGIYLCCQRMTGIQLPVGTKVGSGLLFNHYGCIVIASTATIGSYCTVFHGVTIGRTWSATPPPEIGD